MRLVPHFDGTYDLLLEYPRQTAEFAAEFEGKQPESLPKSLSRAILDRVKGIRVRSVKILVSGALVATLAFSAFLTALAATDRYTMGYLYAGTDHQQIEYVNQTNGALDVVSPSYFDLREDGSLKLNYLSPYFIRRMHDSGIKVVPFLSNHWNRTAGIRALENADELSTQIAHYVEEYDLDGVNVDIENVTHEQRDAYTRFVRLLREKIPRHKEISVAVAANPYGWQTGWQGSYDYTALARYADHLMIMAYDEHYEGGPAGPVASIGFVERSIRYALGKTTADKIVVGIPFYGRVWSTDSDRVVGKGVSSKVIQRILAACPSVVTYDETQQAVRAEFTVTASSGQFIVGANTVLQPGQYVVWFDNDRSYQAKLSLVEKYDLKGAGAWSLGQEDTSIWEDYEGWVNGEEDSPETSPSVPADPERPTVPSLPGGSTGDGVTTPESGGSPAPPATDETVTAPGANPSTPGTDTVTPETGTTTPGGSEPDLLPDTGTTAPDTGDSAPPSEPGEATSPTDPDISVASPSGSMYQEAWIAEGDPRVPVYKNASLRGKVISYLLPGTAVSARDIGGGVCEVRLADGQVGYIAAAYLTEKAPSSPPSAHADRMYEVQPGDSLWKIASRELGNGTRYAEIQALNGLTGDRILPGQVLKLPH